jgi:hypothetical protein
MREDNFRSFITRGLKLPLRCRKNSLSDPSNKLTSKQSNVFHSSQPRRSNHNAFSCPKHEKVQLHHSSAGASCEGFIANRTPSHRPRPNLHSHPPRPPPLGILHSIPSSSRRPNFHTSELISATGSHPDYLRNNMPACDWLGLKTCEESKTQCTKNN